MEFEQVVLSRRSIRKYTGQPVTDEDLEYILKCGLSAPSGVNFQPWYFVVIRSQDQMKRLCGVMNGVSEKLTDNLTERFRSHPEIARESLVFIRRLGDAPVVILAFRHKTRYTKTDETIVQSISAAMENILLAAVDRGLGGCWMTAPIETADEEKLRQMFAPQNGKLVAMLTIGHPADVPAEPVRKAGRYVIL